MTVAVPDDNSVKVKAQLPLASKQLWVLSDPEGASVMATAPVGVRGDPAAEVSVTVTVHLAG